MIKRGMEAWREWDERDRRRGSGERGDEMEETESAGGWEGTETKRWAMNRLETGNQ